MDRKKKLKFLRELLRVGPNTSLKVCEPRPNSGVLVLPITMAPAALVRWAMSPSSGATKSFMSGLPNVVRRPCALAKSLMAWGMPCIQPMDWPRASCASRSRACAIKSSGSCRLTMALDCGLNCAMRSSVACMTSWHDTCLR